MYRVFRDSPEVWPRTLDIAERCSLHLEKVATPFAPQFDPSAGYTKTSYFVHVSRELLGVFDGYSRCTEQIDFKHPISHSKHCERELAIIQQMDPDIS